MIEINSEYINKRLEVMQTTRKDLEILWEENYRQVEEDLSRYGERGEELNAVKINLSQQKVNTATRFMASIFLYQKKFFHYLPRCADDIVGAKAFEDYVKYIVSEIPAFDELAVKWLLQVTTKGFSPAKILPIIKNDKLQGVKFLPIHTNDMWLDPAWAIGLIRDFFFEYRLTEDDLRNFVDDELFNETQTNKFIDANKNPEAPDPRKKDLEIEGKTIPTEQHEGEYRIKEYWYKQDNKDTGLDEWVLQTWGVDNDGKMTHKLRPFNQSEGSEEGETDIYWFGHPFVFGIDVPSLYNIAGKGEPYLIGDYGRGMTRLVNQKLDYNDIAVNPPIVIRKDAFDDESDLNPLVNPRLGGMAILNKIGPGYLDWFKLPASPQDTQWLMNSLMEFGQEASFYDKYLSGAGSSRQEPATTSLMNRDQAMGSINFKAWVIGWAFKELAKKLLICVQQYAPKEEFVRVTGKRGFEFLKLEQGMRSKKDKVITGVARNRAEDEGIYEEKTLKLQAEKKEAIKMYDVEAITILEDSPEALAKKSEKYLQYGAQIPMLQTGVNWLEFLRQMAEGDGFTNLDVLIPPQDMLNPGLNRILAKVPEDRLIAWLRELGLLPREEGQGQGSVGVSGATQAPGTSQPVADVSNSMRQDRA